ncbi:MAG: LamG domain-containing protein [Pseudomonadota bacterium]
MKSHARIRSSVPLLSGTLLALLASVACSGGGSPATGGSAGDKATGGAGGASSNGGTSAGGTSGSASGAAGASAGTAGAISGGASSGGASSGGSGGVSGSAGQNTGAIAGSAGSAGGSGGAGNCAGRSLALLANGTGSDSDAAYARVVIDLASALPIGNAKRTVEFWAYIKSTDWVGDKNEIYYYGASGTTTAFGMDFGTNAVTGMASNHATLNPFTDGGFNVDSAADLGITSSNNQWVHIAMTWDGTALLTYVNGKLGITSNGMGGTTMLATAAGPLMIGCNPENKACFNGLFDEFSVWSVARTATEIKDNYTRPRSGSETGLVGYWKFDDAPGSTTAADSVKSGSAHAGTLMATATAQLPTFVTPPAALPLVCP